MDRPDIWFCGDVHGDLRKLRRSVTEAADKPRALILLGDLDPPEPVGQWLAPLAEEGTEVWFIHGNHETDNDLLYANMFMSPGTERNLDGRVVEICGLRIAGLGGIFREQAWYPPAAPSFERYTVMAEHLLGQMPKRLRGGSSPRQAPVTDVARSGRLRKHRSSIFPDVYHRLADSTADILVVHEAPSCHPYGFEAIDLLAQAMGARWVVHGHHHDSLDYSAHRERMRFSAIGVEFRGVTTLENRVIRGGAR